MNMQQAVRSRNYLKPFFFALVKNRWRGGSTRSSHIGLCVKKGVSTGAELPKLDKECLKKALR